MAASYVGTAAGETAQSKQVSIETDVLQIAPNLPARLDAVVFSAQSSG